MFKPVKSLGEVMALAYLVNTNTEYCVFVRYSGHVDKIQIEICQDKEDGYKTQVYESEFYVNGKHEEKEPEKLFLDLKTALESYLMPRLEELPCTN